MDIILEKRNQLYGKKIYNIIGNKRRCIVSDLTLIWKSFTILFDILKNEEKNVHHNI